MSAKPSSPTEPPRPAPGPGRPKDLAKRAAILDAAVRMFTRHGFEGASMDQIAAEAAVSKLTVYSHFGDKETLFGDALRVARGEEIFEVEVAGLSDTRGPARVAQALTRAFCKVAR